MYGNLEHPVSQESKPAQIAEVNLRRVATGKPGSWQATDGVPVIFFQ